MIETSRNSPGGTVSDDLVREVAHVIRTVADREVRRFLGRLSSDEIVWKDANQVVTPADLRIEQQLIAALGKMLPGGVVSEESGNHDAWKPDGFTWIIDPVDGSAEFIQGSAEYATAVALWSRDHLEAAWIYAPAKNQLWCAHRGQGWQLDGTPANRSDHWAPVSVTSDQYISTQLQHIVTRVRAAGERIVPCRTVSLAYAALATGGFGAAIYDWDKPWDHAPGILLCIEAGLRVRHLDDQHYDPRNSWSSPLLIAPLCRWETLAHHAV